MLRALTAFLGRDSAPAAEATREQELKLATAVLLVEVARADFAEALLKADFDRTEFFRFGASSNF